MVTKTDPQSISSQRQSYFKTYTQSKITMQSPVANAAGNYLWSDVSIGVENPEWRSDVRRMINATTNYSKTGYENFILDGNAEVIFTDSAGRTQIIGWFGHPHNIVWGSLADPLTYDATLADRLARQQFVAKYRSKRTAFQSGIFLGELSKTVKMIRNPASALRSGIDRYFGDVKKRLRRSRNRKRTIRDTWLEYVFGWTPLIHDISDACKLATVRPFSHTESIKQWAEDEISVEKTKSDYTLPNGLRVNYVIVTRGTVSVLYKGAIGLVNHPPDFPEQLGLSWSNVLPTVYELIPYSWLLDYFTNVGKVIEGVSTGTINLNWGSRNTRSQTTREILNGEFNKTWADGFNPAGGRNSGHAYLAGKLSSRKAFTRSIISQVSLGFGDFGFRLPGSAKKWLNIAALRYLK